MEIGELGVAAALVLVAVIAMFAFANSLNATYGTSVGAGLSGTEATVETLTSSALGELGNTSADNINPQTGSNTGTLQDSLISKGLSAFNSAKALVSLFPNLISEAGAAIGVPAVYATIAGWLLFFLFAVTLAYLFIIGARRIQG